MSHHAAGGQFGPVFTFWFMLGILTLVTVFGVGTALNMIFKRWWLSLVLFGAGTVCLAFTAMKHMVLGEWVLYGLGLIGAGLSAWGVRALKKSGYALFT
ncbi:MAG: hypothetical protein K6T83_07500 [Alicyclobacillus sp.]|nr:hypothetical protein [Alicyclobacillus sp.]